MKVNGRDDRTERRAGATRRRLESFCHRPAAVGRWALALVAVASICGAQEATTRDGDESSIDGGAQQAPAAQLAVLRSTNRAANAWWDEVGAERAQVRLIEKLSAGGNYLVMPREKVAETLTEKRLWLTGEVSPARAVRLGRELDVPYLLASTLVEFGTGARSTRRMSRRKLLGLGGPKSFKTEIVLRLIETGRGATVWSDSRRAVTPLGDILSSAPDDGSRVEDAVFEQTLMPLLDELTAQLAAAGSGASTPEVEEPAGERSGV